MGKTSASGGVGVLRACENKDCTSPNPTFYQNQANCDGLDTRCKDCKRKEKRRLPLNKRKQLCNADIAHEIRSIWINTETSLSELSQRYGFNVYNIIRNKTWYDPKYIRPARKVGRK